MPAWTGMRTLTANSLVTEADMDAFQGNIEYLLNPNKDVVQFSNGTQVSDTNTTWSNVDVDNLAVTLTANGGPVLIGVAGRVANIGAALTVNFDVARDGTRLSNAASGFAGVYTSGQDFSFTFLDTAVTAGGYTYTLQWSANNSNGHSLVTKSAGYMPNMWAIEL